MKNQSWSSPVLHVALLESQAKIMNPCTPAYNSIDVTLYEVEVKLTCDLFALHCVLRLGSRTAYESLSGVLNPLSPKQRQPCMRTSDSPISLPQASSLERSRSSRPTSQPSEVLGCKRRLSTQNTSCSKKESHFCSEGKQLTEYFVKSFCNSSSEGTLGSTQFPLTQISL